MNFGMIALIAVYMLLSSGGLVLYKMGAERGLSIGMADGFFNMRANALVFVGLLCYLVSFLMYMFLVSKFDLSYIVPMTAGIIYVLTLVASVTVFKESMGPVHIAGVVLILAGVVLINIKR